MKKKIYEVTIINLSIWSFVALLAVYSFAIGIKEKQIVITIVSFFVIAFYVLLAILAAVKITCIKDFLVSEKHELQVDKEAIKEQIEKKDKATMIRLHNCFKYTLVFAPFMIAFFVVIGYVVDSNFIMLFIPSIILVVSIILSFVFLAKQNHQKDNSLIDEMSMISLGKNMLYNQGETLFWGKMGIKIYKEEKDNCYILVTKLGFMTIGKTIINKEEGKILFKGDSNENSL